MAYARADGPADRGRPGSIPVTPDDVQPPTRARRAPYFGSRRRTYVADPATGPSSHMEEAFRRFFSLADASGAPRRRLEGPNGR